MSEPAFPLFVPYGKDDAYQAAPGMSLRDYFAGQVIAQIVRMYAADNKVGIGVDHLPRNCALHAYALADALLRARQP